MKVYLPVPKLFRNCSKTRSVSILKAKIELSSMKLLGFKISTAQHWKCTDNYMGNKNPTTKG